VSNVSAQGRKKISYKAKDSYYEKKDGKEIIKLYKEVVFKHEGILMYCDSAYFYQKEQSMDAFSNIHVNQGDTVHLYGDKMFYNGKTKQIKIEGNVRMVDKKMTLNSNLVNYDRNTGLASYYGGGTIVNEENTLFSKIGSYNSQTEWFTFKDSVHLTHPKYVISSDTLLYHPESGITRFRGPSQILADSSFISCSWGDYDTHNEIAYFSKRAEIHDKSRILIGDSIYYNRTIGKGELFGRVNISDTIEKFIIRGEYANYQDRPENAFVTGSPLYTMLAGEDSVHIHGDTLRIITNRYGQKKIKVYPNALIYKQDFQGKCDSLIYNESDSIINMYVEPVLWNGKSQLTARDIILKLRNNSIDSIFMIKDAFILTEVDSVKYDQIRGKNMSGNFIDNQLRNLVVVGNGQTVYTVVDKGEQQGINRADCSDLIVRFKDGDVYQVIFIEKPDAKMYPIDQIPSGELFLRGFNPRLDEKPKSKQDLMNL